MQEWQGNTYFIINGLGSGLVKFSQLRKDPVK